jgi:hypothetical protein
MAFDTDKWWNIWRPQIIGFITSKNHGSVYVENVEDPARIFNGRLSYAKGAYVLHMLRWVVGEEAFFAAVRNYLSDPGIAYGYASQQDLVYHLEREADTSLTRFFDDWYYGEGYPQYFANCWMWDDETIEIVLRQQQSHPSVSFFEMPVPIRFKNGWYDTTIVLQHNTDGQRFMRNIGFTPDSAFIDPEYRLISADNQVELDNEIPEEKGLKIFGSLSTDIVDVVSKKPVKKIELYHTNGALVFEKQVAMKKTVALQLRHLPAGLYVVRVMMEDNSVETKKVVVYH